MTIFLSVLAGVVGLLALFAVVVALQPAGFRVERSATVSASPRAVFDVLNDFHNWDRWSPWSKIDPDLKVTYSGPPSGVGAGYAWEGNKQVGKGRMTITESRPGERVLMDLNFEKPFKADNVAEFALTTASGGTTVTWAMTGRKNFLFKAVGLFMDMDKMCGKDFETGLANLRALVEAPSLARAA